MGSSACEVMQSLSAGLVGAGGRGVGREAGRPRGLARTSRGGARARPASPGSVASVITAQGERAADFTEASGVVAASAPETCVARLWWWLAREATRSTADGLASGCHRVMRVGKDGTAETRRLLGRFLAISDSMFLLYVCMKN